ncbi:hypothetical protein B0H19DRAFT_1376163 [Mycena capillaripes]|nr:hypothetical protein B0H19DRAFT_1376163 [Mycena capillaripes]
MTSAALCAQISELSSAISSQKQLLDDMQTRLRDLQAQLHSIPYPVLTLPPEITSEIFVHCLPPEKSWSSVRDKGVAPQLLTRVCREWRQIAISTPALWANFHVNLDTEDYLPRLAEIAKLWLTRTGKCPLSIKIDGQFTRMLETLQCHSREIRTLELHMNVAELERVRLRYDSPLDFAQLRRLSILAIESLDSEGSSPSPIEIFNNVPLLRDLLLTAEVPLSFVSLPWQQLTKFTGELYIPAQCLKALRLMPNLTECAFLTVDDNLPHEGFSHPNVQHFTFTCVIMTLEIRDLEEFNADVLDAFISRSSPPLRKFMIRPLEDWDGADLQFSSLLKMPDLRELEMWHPANGFLPSFFNVFQRNNFLPQLQKLSLMGCLPVGNAASVYNILLHAAVPIASRRNVVAGRPQLQSFRVVTKHPWVYADYPEDQLRPFKILKSLGMDIHIGTASKSVIELEDNATADSGAQFSA